MKPFNLEAAKRGAKLITRDECEVEISFWDMCKEFPLGGRAKTKLDHWGLYRWTETGMVHMDGTPHCRDLFMAPVKRKVWVCYFGENHAVDRVGEVFTSREQAENCCKVSHSIHEVEVEL